MRVNRVERREHERRSGQDRRKMPDRKNSKMETTDRRKEEKRKEIRREEDAEKRFDDQIEGRNSVLELLESGKDVNKIFVTRGEKHGSINKILGIAKERKIIVVEKDKKQMDEMAQEENYQGVIAIVPPFEYVEISDILEVAKERNEDPFVIGLDGIEDPHNLGSIIRTAETAGVHGVIIPKRRAVSVNSTVNKASAGAVEHMKIARVTNISDAIEELKQAGLWVCGTAVDTNKYYYNQDLTGPLAIVIGNEGKGIGEKVKKNCDFLVKIPMKGKVQSLNASVSTGIVVYEAVKQRIRKEN
ncbi:MAG: 23S rRNA (guanosine(2251)-2'-O)-methyltransferase RlmB [Clostridia bacterium]|nr:23S rRNA (guanosine(2251)-2'-O)-methyltransferase RlmB [Clostridia bacterium]